MKKQFICIVCPLGCTLTAEVEDGKVVSVSGNTCPRGEKYARNEVTNPVRTVTSTVKTSDGHIVSVKTNMPIPKSKIFECMTKINSVKIDLPISVGDVIIKGVCGTDSDIVATSEVK